MSASISINLWKIAMISLVIGILFSLIPIGWALLKKVKLKKTSFWFGESKNFGEQQQRLIEHECRMEGTLIYWKNKAYIHHRIHLIKVIWSLISAVTLPVLVQFYNKNDPWSVAFLTCLTTWTGFIVALAHALRSEQLYQAYRQCESDYYDMARNLLDWPESDPQKLKNSVDIFIKNAEKIRQVGRKTETGSPPSYKII